MDTKSEDTPQTDIEDLIWALFDEQISEVDFQRLEAALRSDGDVRRLYVRCVQIHVGLQCVFGDRAEAATSPSFGAPLDVPLANGDAPMTDPAV